MFLYRLFDLEDIEENVDKKPSPALGGAWFWLGD
jgi:hypothetical protein